MFPPALVVPAFNDLEKVSSGYIRLKSKKNVPSEINKIVHDYYRMLLSGCAWNIDGGGWTLVRHSYNKWPKAKDSLNGTAWYGRYKNDPTSEEEFSTPFKPKIGTQFLFSNGDCTKWLVTTYDEFGTAKGANYEARILKSHISDSPYFAKWYHRTTNLEDPWISYMDHWTDNRGTCLYGGNSNGHNKHNINGQHCNVWIRTLERY